MDFNNSIKMCWGYYSSVGKTSVTITLPCTFSNAKYCVQITICCSDDPAGYIQTPDAAPYTKTQIKAFMDYYNTSANLSVRYFCIGF